MSRSEASTRERILSSAYLLFYNEGFARVSMAAIVEETGVTKKGLYYHFASKDELAGEVLRHQHSHALGHIKSWYKSPAKTPSDFVINMFENLEGWASKPKWLGSGFTRLTMELADLPGHPARSAFESKAVIHRRQPEGPARAPSRPSERIG